MSNGVLETSKVTQVGIIVKDIEATAREYAAFLGLPMPQIVVTDGLEKSQAEYLGSSCPARAKLAFFHVGENLDIELIEPDENPSTWREFLDNHGEGVHHIAFGIKDTKGKIEKLEKMNMPLVQKGEYEGGRYAYIDTTAALKVMIETLENDA